MTLTIPREDLLRQLVMQLKSFFLIDVKEEQMLDGVLDNVLIRCEPCFCGSGKCQGTHPVFDPYHSVKYMIFLYTMANELGHINGRNTLSDKVYYLNKIMNGVDLFYEIELPRRWFAEHPVGSVMGRAQYGENFMFFQNCTVGGIETPSGSVYPILGKGVHMYADSSIIGKCRIGNNVCIGAGTLVKNQNIPDNSLVFGQSPNIIIKANKSENIFGT